MGTNIFSHEKNEGINDLKAETQAFAQKVVAQLKVGATQDCSDSETAPHTVSKTNMAIKAY